MGNFFWASIQEGDAKINKRRKYNFNPKRTILKRGNTMIKAGDTFKNIESNKVFTVKSISPSMITLTTKAESHSMFVNPRSIESFFLPFAEDEGKRNLKL